MKQVLALAACLALSGCATYAAGEDPEGQKLQAAGIQVLKAVHDYMDDTSREPTNLQQLVPKYLPAIPTEPKILFDPKSGYLLFEYVQGGPTGMKVECRALVGQEDWACT